MILSRAIEQLKQQHWASVFIELVVVVLGVFIGLQVDNWTDGRKERARERVYLQGIAADLGESIDSIKESIDLERERRAEGEPNRSRTMRFTAFTTSYASAIC